MLVPIVLLIVDLSTIVMAATKNDSVCREACRAAASAKPDDSKTVAEAEINKYNQEGSAAKFSLASAPIKTNIEMPASGHGLVGGSVTVRTIAIVHAPFLVGFFVPTVSLQAEYSFPYTYNVP